MRKYLFALACIVAASSAQAEPAYNWTGLYLGAQGGYGGDKFEYPGYLNTGVPAFSGTGQASLTSSGFIAGGQVGYNLLLSNILVGVEADLAWSGIEGEVAIGGSGVAGGSVSVSAGSEIEHFGTIRGRLGFAKDNLLIYGTAGVAYGKVTSSYSYNANFAGLGIGPFSGADSISDNQWGWTAGGGLEYGVGANWSLKTEYLYTDLGSQTLYADNTVGIDVDTKFHTVKVGLNYHFNADRTPPLK